MKETAPLDLPSSHTAVRARSAQASHQPEVVDQWDLLLSPTAVADLLEEASRPMAVADPLEVALHPTAPVDLHSLPTDLVNHQVPDLLHTAAADLQDQATRLTDLQDPVLVHMELQADLEDQHQEPSAPLARPSRPTDLQDLLGQALVPRDPAATPL